MVLGLHFLLLPWVLQVLGGAWAKQSKSTMLIVFILTVTQLIIPRAILEHTLIIFTC